MTATEVRDLEDRLLAVVRDHLDGDWITASATRLSGGTSRETWRVVLADRAGRARTLALRRDPMGDARRDGMAREAAVISAAHAHGIPVPEVLVVEEDPAVLGSAFMLMPFIEGETAPRSILRDEAFALARERFADQVGAVLAGLHNLGEDEVAGLPDRDLLVEYRQQLDAIGQSNPAFELAYQWLVAHRPAPLGRTVVHADFRLGNLMFDTEGIRAVLDWELAHIGDPTEDLGYLCVKAWRFGSLPAAAGLAGLDDLRRSYEHAGGRHVPAETLKWWVIAGTFKWGVACLTHGLMYATGVDRSLERAAIARRVCESEYELMRMIG